MNWSKVIRQVTIAGAAFAAAAAAAHPGHGAPGTNTTIFHLLTEPDHVLMLLSAIGVGVIAVIDWRGVERRKPGKRRED